MHGELQTLQVAKAVHGKKLIWRQWPHVVLSQQVTRRGGNWLDRQQARRVLSLQITMPKNHSSRELRASLLEKGSMTMGHSELPITTALGTENGE